MKRIILAIILLLGIVVVSTINVMAVETPPDDRYYEHVEKYGHESGPDGLPPEPAFFWLEHQEDVYFLDYDATADAWGKRNGTRQPEDEAHLATTILYLPMHIGYYQPHLETEDRWSIWANTYYDNETVARELFGADGYRTYRVEYDPTNIFYYDVHDWAYTRGETVAIKVLEVYSCELFDKPKPTPTPTPTPPPVPAPWPTQQPIPELPPTPQPLQESLRMTTLVKEAQPGPTDDPDQLGEPVLVHVATTVAGFDLLVPSIQYDGYTYLQVRGVANARGIPLIWDGVNKEVQLGETALGQVEFEVPAHSDQFWFDRTGDFFATNTLSKLSYSSARFWTYYPTLFVDGHNYLRAEMLWHFFDVTREEVQDWLDNK